MRRPINWFVFALSLGVLALGRALLLPGPQPLPAVVERVRVEPRVAIAVPAALRGQRELEFGYVERDR
jgi:hypothetical protein